MPRRDSTANPLPYSDWILEMLLDSARRFQSIEGQIILAQMCFELERDHLVSRALEWLTVKQWMPRFRRSVCNVTQCFGFHDLGSPKFVGAILGHLDATSGLRLMRASRKRSIRSDLEEICSDRRGLLADLHQRLGRHQLAQDLRTPAKQH
jgi:hypothetical protein